MEQRDEKLVFQGERYRVYQWEQKLFDGTTATFERVERPPSVTIFAAHQEKIVIQKQNQPHLEKEFYSVPGGEVDEGEEILEAAKRELLEEEGLESDEWEYWLLGGKQSASFNWDNHIYIAKNCQKIAEPDLDAGERIEHLLFTREEFFQLLEHPDFRHQDILPKLLTIRNDSEKRRVFLDQLGLV